MAPGRKKRVVAGKRKANEIEEEAKVQEVVAPAPTPAAGKSVEELNAQIAFLTKQLKSVVKDEVPISKKSKIGSSSKAMANEVKKATVEFCWPKVKFLNDPEMLNQMTINLFNYMDLQEKEGLEGEELEVAKALWVKKWRDTVRKAYNTHRNYVQQQVHDLMKPLFEGKKDHDLPTPEEVYKVVKREGLQEGDPEEMERLLTIFLVYWERFLPCVCGVSRWGPNQKYYQTIRDGRLVPEDPESPPCVTAGDEAYFAVLYENSFKKWEYSYNICHFANKKPDDNAPEMVTPYTNPKSGQTPFGGWLQEGKNKFIEIKKQVVEGRKGEHVKQLEEEVLESVRKNANRDEVDKKRKEKGKKGKKKKPTKPATEPVVLSKNMDDWE